MRAASIHEPGDGEDPLGKDVDKLLQKKLLAVGVVAVCIKEPLRSRDAAKRPDQLIMVRHDLALVIAPAPDMGARLDDEREQQSVRNLRNRRFIPHHPAFQHRDAGIGAGRFEPALVQYPVHRFERRRVQAEMR